MKLVAVVLASLFALPSLARAEGEQLDPPSGPVYVEVRNDQVPPQQRARNHRLKQALMEQFDTNGDGRLEPRERMRAIRVLNRIERKLAGRDGQRGQRGTMRRRFIERFDTNHDGNVDQSEMPPGAARKLRRFDRDRDGWVEPGELR